MVHRYVDALTKEIERSDPPALDEVVDTIFFGGGTPTAIPAADEAAILKMAVGHVRVGEGAEITTEANPGTADIAGLAILRAAGFNRISFGVQSFDDALLRSIDRIHSADEAKKAVRAARSAGFDNVSIDLMFGLPGQTMTQWRDTLDQALELETDHLSMYALIVEDETGFGKMLRAGTLFLPEDDLSADMYLASIERASAAGYQQYEISNFARPGRECRHNLHYWRLDDYLGYGAGAVQSRAGVRRTNVLRPAKYVQAIESGSDLGEINEELTADIRRGESMMLGLRMTSEGVDVERFSRLFGRSPLACWPSEIRHYTRIGLLEAMDQEVRLRLTPRGVFLANEVMQEFV
jgi:oxygen-independent coproporphyrinogen-3 oxidase